LVTKGIARIIIVTHTLVSVPAVEVVVDVFHLLLGLRAVIALVIISSAYLAPWISFHSTNISRGLDGLISLFRGRFHYFLHEEVHRGRELVHLIEGVDTSLLGLEALLIPSLVDDHLFNEVLGNLDIFLQKCTSS